MSESVRLITSSLEAVSRGTASTYDRLFVELLSRKRVLDSGGVVVSKRRRVSFPRPCLKWVGGKCVLQLVVLLLW